MTFHGRFENGVIIPSSPISLPEGTEVEISTLAPEIEEPSWGEVFQDLVGKAKGLPADLAHNHDHYLHGAPKK